MSFRRAYGNDWSENGWRMCNRDECSLPISPDMIYINTAPIRNGSPLVILSAWLKYYDLNIASVDSPVWGWSRDNDVSTSNHLSGTALDINAPKWPWGARTMPMDLKARIRKGLDLFEGTVFWGADWSRADEMHFQMNFQEGDARNDAFAAKLQAGYLGLLAGSPAIVKPKEDDVSWLSEKYENFKKTPNMKYSDWAWWVDKNTSDTKDRVIKIEADIAEIKAALNKLASGK